MSSPSGPVAPQGASAKKKGLGPLAWVAIGCAGILVLGGLVATILGVFVAGRVRDMAQKMEEDPVAATAEIVAATNPDIELVETDEDARTVTFRDTRTGEEFTIDYEELQQGRVALTSGGETATLELETDGEDTGQLTVRTDDGTTEFRAGGTASLEDVPDWVPVFPGVEARGTFSSSAESTRAGALAFETQESLEEVLAFYENEVESAGLAVQSRTTTPDGALLVAGDPDGGRGLSVIASRKDGTVEVVVNYTETR